MLHTESVVGPCRCESISLRISAGGNGLDSAPIAPSFFASANVCDYLKPGDVSQKKIDNTKPEAPLARLVYSIHSVRHEHNLVAVRLEHKPERVAY